MNIAFELDAGILFSEILSFVKVLEKFKFSHAQCLAFANRREIVFHLYSDTPVVPGVWLEGAYAYTLGSTPMDLYKGYHEYKKLRN